MVANILNNPKAHIVIFLVILFGCILLLFGRLYISGSAIGGDAVYYYSNLRSIIIDQDLNFKNEYYYFHNQTSDFTGNRKIPIIPQKNQLTDKFPAKYPIGSAIFLSPPFLLTHGISITLEKFGVGITTDGYNLLYQSSAALGSLFYAFAGLLLIYKLGTKIFNPQIAFLGTLIIWLATPLIYYMTMEPLSSQPISVFCISLFIYLWYTTRKKSTIFHWVILGIVGGLMSIVRYQDSLFLLIPIIDNFKKLYPPFFSFKLFLFLLLAGLIISPQLFINNYLYSSPFQTGYGDAGFPYITSPEILYTLFSPERGLLVWSPILIFAFIGLYWFTKKAKLVGFLLLFSFLIQVYIISSWADPSQGDSFGNRILLNSSIIFAIGIMQFLKNIKVHQKLFLLTFTLLILLNNILAALFIFRITGQPY